MHLLIMKLLSRRDSPVDHVGDHKRYGKLKGDLDKLKHRSEDAFLFIIPKISDKFEHTYLFIYYPVNDTTNAVFFQVRKTNLPEGA